MTGPYPIVAKGYAKEILHDDIRLWVHMHIFANNITTSC